MLLLCWLRGLQNLSFGKWIVGARIFLCGMNLTDVSMENLPSYISIVFVGTTLLTLFFFWRASYYSKWVLGLSLAWLGVQTGLGMSGFYTDTTVMPPRFLLLFPPTLVVMILLFATAKGRAWIDGLDLRVLTLLHVVRIPVEMVLFWLSVQLVLPDVLTFEGRNFDIFSGITAPIVWYWGFVRGKLSRGVLLAWNFICLALVLNVVMHAILAVPTPFQQIAFDQPNVAILHFPFNWLPAFVVPVVWFSHFVAIRRLWRRPTVR
jgi:hypothetical protein